jgi:catechol 2,3-dioxygenase-like lactoylglutathione lyase family enzyme
MELGKFSMSLAVKDLAASREFYEKLGFKVTDGAAAENWLILSSDETTIGLFQDMFDVNILTFSTPDVRAAQKALKDAGLKLTKEIDENAAVPDHILLQDPDGNTIMLDPPDV